MPKEDLHIKQAAALVAKLEGNSLFSSGNIAGAASKYSEALSLCPMRSKKERVVLYSNRAQCHLLYQQPWLPYVMLLVHYPFIIQSIAMPRAFGEGPRRVPDCAERLVKKQMRAAWLFREAAVKHGGVRCEGDAGDMYGQEADDSEWETASESVMLETCMVKKLMILNGRLPVRVLHLSLLYYATRAISLHNPVNRHAKSLWRRAQAYDMLGLAKESLLDVILFINECSQSNDPDLSSRRIAILSRMQFCLYHPSYLNLHRSRFLIFQLLLQK